MSERKVIITCAVTGGAAVPPKHPHFPVTPKEIADDCIEAARGGASIVHIHARDPETTLNTSDIDTFTEIVDRVRQAPVDVIVNLTCGSKAFFIPDPDDESRAGAGTDVGTPEERYAHIEACRPDICSLDVTTSNQVADGEDYVYLNTPRTLRKMASRFQELGVKPELEVFEAVAPVQAPVAQNERVL